MLVTYPGTTIEPFEPHAAEEEPPTALALADAELQPDPELDGFRLVPVDFPRLLVDGVPEVPHLEFPYFPRAARIWIFGPAESVKALFMQWMTAKLTRAGMTVVFVSQENPLATDLDRMGRLGPDFGICTYFHMSGLDLADPTHFVELALVCQGADLLVIDTLSACWSGDEGSNADVVKLDREVLAQLVRLTGVTAALVHHTGNLNVIVPNDCENGHDPCGTHNPYGQFDASLQREIPKIEASPAFGDNGVIFVTYDEGADKPYRTGSTSCSTRSGRR